MDWFIPTSEGIIPPSGRCIIYIRPRRTMRPQNKKHMPTLQQLGSYMMGFLILPSATLGKHWEDMIEKARNCLDKTWNLIWCYISVILSLWYIHPQKSTWANAVNQDMVTLDSIERTHSHIHQCSCCINAWFLGLRKLCVNISQGSIGLRWVKSVNHRSPKRWRGVILTP